MSNDITISAVMLGKPSNIRFPKPTSGESIDEFIVRNFPDEWERFVNCMKNDYGVPENIYGELRSARIGALINTVYMERYSHWANMRLPRSYRTLYDLSNMRKQHKNMSLDEMELELTQIIWLLKDKSLVDNSTKILAAEMDAELLSIEKDPDGCYNFFSLLSNVRGKYLWIVPSGSILDTYHMPRIIETMEREPKYVMCKDAYKSYSTIYNVPALYNIFTYEYLPFDQNLIARIIENKGYLANKEYKVYYTIIPLCRYEKIYEDLDGYSDQNPSIKRENSEPQGKKSFFRRLFGR